MQASAPRPFGQFLDAVVDIFIQEIDRDGAGGARQFQSLRNRVDGDNALGPKQERAPDRHLSDRSAAPDGDRVTLLDVAEIRRHVAGRENVGEEQHLFVAQACRHLDRPDIGVGHAKILRLAAREAAEKVRVAKQASWRMTPHRLGLFLAFLRIGALAAGEGAALAEEALAAGDDERHHDAIADFQVGDAGSDFDNLAHVLVAEHIAAVHVGNDAIVEVEIGAANGAGGDLDDRVRRRFDRGVGHALATNVMFAVPGECAHRNLSLNSKPKLWRALLFRNALPEVTFARCEKCTGRLIAGGFLRPLLGARYAGSR